MRPSFRKNLEQYNTIAKDELSDVRDVSEDLDAIVEFYAIRRGSNTDAQKTIYEIQKEKQQIMQEMKQAIASLDKTTQAQEKQPDRHTVIQHEKIFYVKTGEGSELEPLTLGEIMADGMWGIEYNLDANTVPRNVRKRYIVEQTKRKLQTLLDRQIIRHEVDNTKTKDYKKKAYRALGDNFEPDSTQWGVIAEKIIQHMLMVIQYDNPQLNFQIIPSDAYQDVQQKIDFFIVRPQRTTGVDVEASENVSQEHIGIQFTINDTEEAQKRKLQQLRRSRSRLRPEENIDDITLVTVSAGGMMAAYHKWKQDRNIGGPTRFLTESYRQRLLNSILESGSAPRNEL